MSTLKLYTFSVSHFSEKIRWVLDASSLPYTEHALTPFFHVPTMLRKGGRGATTVPLLEADGVCIQDSTRILLWLEKHRAPFKLIPTGAAREAVLRWEEEMDEIGGHVVRFAYADTLENSDATLSLWSLNASDWQARLLRLGYPLLKLGFRQLLRIHPRSVARSREKIGAMLDRIEAHLATGARYLVGGTFSAADLSAAALLAPLACPDEHPVYSRSDYRAGMAPTVGDWQQRPALEWVRQLYHQHRRKPL